jgi:pyruvate dehydrogenase E1 component beta subunit
LIPFDVDTVVKSVEKTGKILVVEENHRRGGWGGFLIAEVSERRGRPLQTAPVRLTCPDVPFPFAPTLEPTLLPDDDAIEKAIRDLVGRPA